METKDINQVAVEALLRELVAEVRLLRQDLRESRRPAVSLNRADRTLLARLLPAIGGVFGSQLFRIRELFESDAPALRVALHGLTAKGIGKLFRRAAGQPVDGYEIDSDGTELNTVLWRVMQVHGFESSLNRVVPPRAAPSPR